MFRQTNQRETRLTHVIKCQLDQAVPERSIHRMDACNNFIHRSKQSDKWQTQTILLGIKQSG